MKTGESHSFDVTCEPSKHFIAVSGRTTPAGTVTVKHRDEDRESHGKADNSHEHSRDCTDPDYTDDHTSD